MSDVRSLAFVDAFPPTAAGPGSATFRSATTCKALDALRELVPSKPMLHRIFDGGQLSCSDGRRINRMDTIEEGELVSLELLVTRGTSTTADESVEVLFQDPFLLAVNKPAGVLVHGDGSNARTLTACVQGLLVRQGRAAVPQALHRLDVDTSGIVLFSLTEEFQPAFDELVSSKRLRKRYFAVIEGRLPEHDGMWLTIDEPIARDRHDARRMRVGRTGKPAVTRVRTVESWRGRTLVEAELVTGRRHQIRVHLAHIGHPLVGDALYGGSRSASGLLLHAHEVRLAHPVTGEELLISCDLPARFRQ